MNNLVDRFFDFCRRYPGAEEIDLLPLTEEQRTLESQKADFLLEQRTLVCEVKSLEEDTGMKLLQFLKDSGLDPAALPAGTHIIEDLFATVPNGAQLFRRATDLVMRPIERGFDNAAGQIRDTKRLFDISSADGLLVILNGSVPIAGPPLVKQRLEQRLGKIDEQGRPYHADITHIIFVNEAHLISQPDGDRSVNLSLQNPTSREQHGVSEFAAKFLSAWAKYNGLPLTDADPNVRDLVESSQLYLKKN